MKKLLSILLLSLCCLVMTATVSMGAGPQKTLPGDITLSQAQHVLQAAVAKAKAINSTKSIANSFFIMVPPV